MEYTQELENLKKEISKSGKTIEGLSGLMQNFSEVANLQDTLKKLREDNVLSRIETKIDILAQEDHQGILSLLIDELNNNLTEKYNKISQKIDNIKIPKGSSKEKAPTTGNDIEDIIEIKESIGLLSQQFRQLMGEIDNLKISLPQSIDKSKFDSIENLVRTQESALMESLSALDANTLHINGNLQKASEDLHNKLNAIEQNLNTQNNNNLQDINENFVGMQEHLYKLQQHISQNNAASNNNEDVFIEIKQEISGLGADITQKISDLSDKSTTSQEETSLNINNINEKIDQLASLVENGAKSEQIKDSFKYLKNELDFICEKLNNDAFSQDMRSRFISLEEKVFSVSENLTSLQNIYAVNESLEALQDKLSLLINGLDIDNDSRTEVQGNFNEVKEALLVLNQEIEQVKHSVNDNTDAVTINNNITNIDYKLQGILGSIANNASSDEINEVKGALLALNQGIEQVKGGVNDNTEIIEVKNNILMLSNKMQAVSESLYPIQSIENIAQSVEAAQDKLNIIIQDIDGSSQAQNNLQSELIIYREYLSKIENAMRENASLLVETTKSHELDELKDTLLSIRERINDNTETTIIKELLFSLERQIASLNDSATDKTETNELKDMLSSMQQEISSIHEKAQNGPDFTELNAKLGVLDEKIAYVTASLYPLHNLYSISENFHSAQEKLALLIEALGHNSTENLNQTLGLDERFGGVQSEIHNGIGDIKDALSYLSQNIEQARAGITGSAELDGLNENLRLNQEKLNLLVENVNDDRNSRQELKTQFRESLDYIRQEIGQITSLSNDESLSREIMQRTDSLDQKVSHILENIHSNENLENLGQNLEAVHDKLNLIVTAFHQNSDLNSDTQMNFQEIKNALYRLSEDVSEVESRVNDNSQLNSINESIDNTQNKLNIIISSIEGNSSANTEIQSNLTNIKEALAFLNQEIGQLKQSANNDSGPEEFDNGIQAAQDRINSLIGNINESNDLLRNDIKYLNLKTEELTEKSGTNSEEIRQALADLNSEIRNITPADNKEVLRQISMLSEKLSSQSEESYPMENIQAIGELFYSAQDKLNILIDTISTNSPENIKNILGLENIFADLNFKIDTEVIDAISSVKDCLNEMRGKEYNLDEIKSALSFLNHGMEKLGENLKYSPSNNISEEVLSTLVSDINTVKTIITRNISNPQLDEINEKITDLGSKISGLQEIDVFKDNINLIKNSLCQLEERFNYTNEKISDLAGFTANNTSGGDISCINNELKSLQQEFSSKLNSNTETLNGFLSKVIGKLDSIQNQGDIEQLKDGVSHLSESIKNSSYILSELCAEVHSINDIQSKVESINGQLRLVSTSDEIADLNGKIEHLTSEIREYKETLSKQSTDEIMNAILDNLGSLNDRMDDISDNNNQEILESLKEIKEHNARNENSITITKEAIDDIKKEFSGLTEGFNGFDNDITDINSKINKLIILSNENTGVVKENLRQDLDSLRKEIKTNLESNSSLVTQAGKDTVGRLSGELEQISQKVENVTSLSIKGLDSNNVIKEAILQMAEWIDSAGSLLENNNENIKKSLKMTTKFDNFEIRLEGIEAKLEQLLDRDYKERDACKT